MKKIALVILMILALLGGIWHCQEARAEWVATGSLLPGQYLFSYVRMDKTTQGRFTVAEAVSQGFQPDMQPVFWMDSYIITVDDRYNAKGLAKILNLDPPTEKDDLVFLFKLDEEGNATPVFPLRWREPEWGEIDL